MKTLTDAQVTMTGDKITICATIKDLPFNTLLVTRVSHGHLNAEAIHHHRRIQSSSAAVFLESPAGKLAIPNSVIAQIAAHAAPETSFPPVFKKGSTPNAVAVASETPYTIQWQVSDNAFPLSPKSDMPPTPAIWIDIEGATGESLNESVIPAGKWVRCIATNLAGKTITRPIQKK